MLLYIEPSDLDMNNKSIKIPKSLENKLMIVMVLADWCGHCKNTLPKYIEAARKNLENNKNVVFSLVETTIDFKTDNTKNMPSQFFDEFRGYHHITLFKNGKEVAKYNGDRSVDSFLTFVNKKY